MAIPIQFLARFAIPMVVALLMMKGQDPEQAALYGNILETSDRTLSIANREGEGPTELYDYIIIGSGSAGSVLANRLTASGTDTVLVLEAGGDPNPISEIPMGLSNLGAANMLIDYVSVPMTKACVIKTRGTCYFGRGKALGGSSSVNGMVYNRCNAKDYDYWANFTGDGIWRFESVVDAFRAVENYHGFYEDNPGPNHGTDGEIYIGKVEFTPGVDTLFEALTKSQIPIVDLNSGENPYGFSKVDYNIKDGLRHSAYHGFIEPILGRPNLKIYRYAWATKIHLDPQTKQALGVNYTRHGQSRYVGAKKEILLAAGVIDSPKLLMLSGIGPASHLAQHGIETVLDLPAVGDHLQEHLGVDIHPFTINKTFGIVDPFTPDNINEYIINATGPMVMVSWWDQFVSHVATGYITSKIYNDPTWPDIHVYINEQLYVEEGKLPEETIFPEIELVRTGQTGTIRLASADPKDFPIIDPRFFEDPNDINRLVEGIEFMVDFFLNSTTYQALGIKWSDRAKPVEECKQYQFASTEYWRCYVQMYSSTGLHPTSTCRMGPNSTVAVVDSKLRVFGAKGLRVIDSSVMPMVPNGNTNMPSIMIGEMGSRIILNLI